jgi:hypothetical protein
MYEFNLLLLTCYRRRAQKNIINALGGKISVCVNSCPQQFTSCNNFSIPPLYILLDENEETKAINKPTKNIMSEVITP